MVGRTDKGLFVTTGHFTPDAKREATRNGAPRIELIDGEQLRELLKTLTLGLKTEMVEHVNVVPEAFKEFEISK
jgi:restriction system protein